MAAVFKLFQRKVPQQELYEPSPRYAHYAAEVNGQLYFNIQRKNCEIHSRERKITVSS